MSIITLSIPFILVLQLQFFVIVASTSSFFLIPLCTLFPCRILGGGVLTSSAWQDFDLTLDLITFCHAMIIIGPIIILF